VNELVESVGVAVHGLYFHTPNIGYKYYHFSFNIYIQLDPKVVNTPIIHLHYSNQITKIFLSVYNYVEKAVSFVWEV
jgi:hypothetical protein